MMLPQNIFQDDSATYETAKSRKAEEFVFAIWTDPDGPDNITMFIMIPFAFWKSKKEYLPCEIRISPFVAHLLPSDCREVSSCFFMSDTPKEELKAELVQRGFVTQPLFDAFVYQKST